MLKETLLKIGLSEKEADTFILIIKSGEITASELSKKGKESRTHIYDTINKLIKKGLIVYVIKNNIKYFKAADPKKLLDYLKEKEAKIKEEKQEILKIIPEIKKLQQEVSKKDETKIEVYEGAEGLKTVLNDIIREGKDFVTWGATSKIKDFVPDFVIERYLKEREKKKIRARQLFTDFYGVLKSPLSENRKLPKEFASPTTTLVYGNKVTIWLWLEIPKVILIENRDLANSYRKHFELMWKQAGKKKCEPT
jgi:sugar-specific transcriptional regulator TrmB